MTHHSLLQWSMLKMSGVNNYLLPHHQYLIIVSPCLVKFPEKLLAFLVDACEGLSPGCSVQLSASAEPPPDVCRNPLFPCLSSERWLLCEPSPRISSVPPPSLSPSATVCVSALTPLYLDKNFFFWRKKVIRSFNCKIHLCTRSSSIFKSFSGSSDSLKSISLLKMIKKMIIRPWRKAFTKLTWIETCWSLGVLYHCVSAKLRDLVREERWLSCLFYKRSIQRRRWQTHPSCSCCWCCDRGTWRCSAELIWTIEKLVKLCFIFSYPMDPGMSGNSIGLTFLTWQLPSLSLSFQVQCPHLNIGRRELNHLLLKVSPLIINWIHHL